MSKIAIFGGTFDPVHWGHLLLAETALDQFSLDRVIWVPTFRPNYKAPPLLTFEHRLEMVRRAIADHSAFTVSAIDEQQPGTSYAIATFNALRALEPNAFWHWIVGNDAFQSLPKWYDSQALIAQCVWLVAPRIPEGEGTGERSQESKSTHNSLRLELRSQAKLSSVAARSATQNSKLPPLRWHQLQMPSVAVSSSLIRERCREGRSIRYLVPEAVHCYIVEQNLYRMS